MFFLIPISNFLFFLLKHRGKMKKPLVGANGFLSKGIITDQLRATVPSVQVITVVEGTPPAQLVPLETAAH
jgi:hypothetical protein